MNAVKGEIAVHQAHLVAISSLNFRPNLHMPALAVRALEVTELDNRDRSILRPQHRIIIHRHVITRHLAWSIRFGLLCRQLRFQIRNLRPQTP